MFLGFGSSQEIKSFFYGFEAMLMQIVFAKKVGRGSKIDFDGGLDWNGCKYGKNTSLISHS
jgi:hypothetical protein